ncbi:MAG: hypothetical protein Q8R47_04285 [Nanoarchaeota archaeon]|nr:hypothetical protein [Nanoarchaeota archaeon]
MLLRASAEVAVGYLYVKVFEHIMHQYVLHGLGKNKESVWSFHFHDHHKAATKHGMLDPAYFEPWWLNPSRAKEVGSLVGGVALHLPLAKKYPFFVATVALGAANYYHKHKKSHMDPEWAWENMQNHVKHHLLDQDAYWGVTSGWVDRLMGTAPEMSPEEWDESQQFYMRRYYETKEKAQEAAKERYKEHKEKFMGSLEGLTDKLYSFFERK